MQLLDLDPRWFSLEIDGKKTGLTFECPHCRNQRLGVLFHHRGSESVDDLYIRSHHGGDSSATIWNLDSDESFSNLTLSPSVDASSSGHWHGFIRNGSIS